MKDIYDEAIERLTKECEKEGHNGPLLGEWSDGKTLFQYASPTGRSGHTKDGPYGCLTMIRDSISYVAITPELTQEICNDQRIPSNSDDIRLEHLPVFAEYQRRLDTERVKLRVKSR